MQMDDGMLFYSTYPNFNSVSRMVTKYTTNTFSNIAIVNHFSTLCYCLYYRWFALMEIHLYVAMVLKMLNITLLDPVPQPVSAHGSSVNTLSSILIIESFTLDWIPTTNW